MIVALLSKGRWPVVGVLLLLAMPLGRAVADPLPALRHAHDLQFVEGLRQRQLFDWAELFCRQRMQEEDLSDRHRAELAGELLQTLAQHAINSAPEKREALWQQADQVMAELVESDPQSGYRALVEVQHAVMQVMRAELMVQEAELQTDRQQALLAARRQLRVALDALEDAQAQIDAQLLRTRPATSGALATSQLHALRNEVIYQMGKARLHQGASYPPESPDRVNSLSQALGHFQSISRLREGAPQVAAGQLLAARCRRLLGQTAAARQLLDQLQSEQPTAELQMKIDAERARLWLDAKEPTQALAVLQQAAARHKRLPGELQLVHVQVLVALWQQASEGAEPNAATPWQDQAVALVEQMEQSQAPYWVRRAEALLARMGREAGGENVPLLSRTAASLYRRGKIDEAMATFAQAAAAAEQRDRPAEALQLQMKIAAIEQQQGQKRQSMQRLAQWARKMADQPQAPEAHWLAVLAAADLVRAQKTDSLNTYAQLLDEHQRHWPNQPTADQARLLLGRLRQRQGKWDEALTLYAQVRPDAAEMPAVVLELRRIVDRKLQQASTHAARQAIVQQALRMLEPLLSQIDPESALTVAEQQAVLASAHWQLLALGQGHQALEPLLRYALQDEQADQADAEQGKSADGSAPGPDRKAVRHQLQVLLSVAYAGQHKLDDARHVLDRPLYVPAAALIGAVNSLSQLAEIAPARAGKQALADLQLRLLENAVITPKPTQADQLALELVRAQTLASNQQRVAAERLLRRLADQYPQQGQVQVTLARFLQQDARTHDQALEQWRRVAAGSPAGSERWFQAKYAVAELLAANGQADQAADMIRLMKTLHPEMGGPAMQQQFDSLLGRLPPQREP